MAGRRVWPSASSRARPMPSPSSRNRHPNSISRARRFIDEHYTEQLKLRDIAQAADLSRSYLCRAFRKANGRTLVEYLTRRRIEKAQVLLRDTDLLVKEVAFLAGFQSVAHFNRIFKDASGVAPSEFRGKELAARAAAALAL